MKFKVGDKVRIKTNLPKYESYQCGMTDAMVGMEGQVHIIKEISSRNHNYKIFTNSGDDYWWFSEEMLEPIVLTLSEVKDGKIDCIVHAQTQEEANILCEELGSDSGWHRPANECWRYYNKDTWYIIQNGLVHQFGDENCRLAYPFIPTCEFSDLFAEGSIVTLKPRDESVSFASAPYLDLSSLILPTNSREFEEKLNKELAEYFNAFPNDGISAKNGGKNSLKFTFYFNVNEGTRVDKSCNGTIPTITTSVVLDKFGDPDRRKCYSLEGEATCDKVDYDMRQGVLEALANAVFDGNFEKAYDKAVKTNAFCERQDRTCHYCGKVLDTIEEKQAHEAWHVECKKARRERYLLRKRAKEIAFEEQAQKMAKEMVEK